MIGLNGLELLNNPDHLETLVSQAVVDGALALRDELDKNLARAIRNEIADALS